MRDKWEPRLTWYNGVPVTTEKGNMHNPVHRIHELCRIEDFCAFKLDIDIPHVEYSLVKQLLENHGYLKEFFFEHHVHNPLMSEYWGAVSICRLKIVICSLQHCVKKVSMHTLGCRCLHRPNVRWCVQNGLCSVHGVRTGAV